MKIALIGAGQRGTIYASYLMDKGIEINAVVEPNPERRTAAVKAFHIPEAYSRLKDFLARGRISDAAIVATMDQDHYACAMPLLDLGYHLLLEKPISPNIDECLRIQQKADANNLLVMVCHVLRYTEFFRTIKETIDSGELGRIQMIEYAEYMGNYHMAHSFVRGKWNNSDTSSPIILQKSCHDMDILAWLTESPAISVSSYGTLSYFCPENAPEGSALRCKDCTQRDSCRFDAYRTYLPMIGKWRAIDVTEDQTEEGMRQALDDGPYGRCVFHCDNNVCDQQTTAIQFANGITAAFQMSAFSDHIHRRIKVMCEHGSIQGDDSEDHLSITRFHSFAEAGTEQEIIPLHPYQGRHGGGDIGIVDAFVDALSQRLSGDTPDAPLEGSTPSVKEASANAEISEIARSIESHIIACAAEESRITGRAVDVAEYRKRCKENGCCHIL